MAVVVVNCPVKMKSLSEAALRKVNGLQHDIERIVGPSGFHPTGKNLDKNLVNAYNVWTMCGKQIDAYPETDQGIERCSLCAKTKKAPADLLLIRIMPPVPEPGAGAAWSNSYWRHHVEDGWVAYLVGGH